MSPAREPAADRPGDDPPDATGRVWSVTGAGRGSGWGEPASDDVPPAVAAAAIRAHVEADDGQLSLLVGDDAPTFVALPLAARRDDYGRDRRFEWQAPAVGAGPVQ